MGLIYFNPKKYIKIDVQYNILLMILNDNCMVDQIKLYYLKLTFRKTQRMVWFKVLETLRNKRCKGIIGYLRIGYSRIKDDFKCYQNIRDKIYV